MIKNTLITLSAFALLASWTPASNAAASCSKYKNQAAAQKQGDTKDADKDGIYCESLPCPCSKKKPNRKKSFVATPQLATKD